MTATRGPRSQIVTYSTDLVPIDQRFDYWVGALCETLFEMSTATKARRGFACRLGATPLDGLLFTMSSGSNQTSFRTRRYVADATRRAFHLVADFAQPWVAVRHGERLRMNPGDLIVLDTNEVHGGLWRDACRVTNIVLPVAWLQAWVGTPATLVGRRIDGRSGWGSALSTFVARLSPSGIVSTPVPLRTIADHLGALLALIEGQQSGSTEGLVASSRRTRSNLAKVTDVVRQRLGETSLDVDAVAGSLDVPAETLHRWLADAGTTFGMFLERQRMAVASNLLCARRHDHLDPAEIGNRVGIDSAPRFARLVARHFGESPVEHRRASGAPATAAPVRSDTR